MEESVADLTTEQLESLIERAIDRRMEVWLTQLLDALYTNLDESEEAFHPEFAAALHRSLEQARAGNVRDLGDFRAQLK
jgi:hypothetical protein